MLKFRFVILAALQVLAFAGLAVFVTAARAAEKQDLVIVTSYPPSFFEAVPTGIRDCKS
ncbi:hypothetical protein HT585_25150 [Ensifer sp. HO-A22]|uniref:Uncharacterized protein n=1 Tax=Ensifer oleiphilus TaxID=2742698 RepID=A0A7Y6QAT0_9HYPH|nr:hypothetical protein [Ensifer oleiphilus]NVD42161.1 hypothetical protein [Ensifer oleiphilus]